MFSLNQILGRLQLQLLTPEQQQLQTIIEVWATIVGQRAIAHTRLISLSRGVLMVATDSASWSQELTLKRSQMLRRLNQRLSNPLNDIKFSTALWHAQADSSPSDPDFDNQPQQHPSYIKDIPPTSIPVSPGTVTPQTVTPQTAFQHWAENIQRRSQSLPKCPHCHCPTPPGELSRWSMCAMCFSHRINSPPTH
ncbi:MAG: DUF721 domain-containing protein [Cyanobacteria bacterium J06592_8]